MKILNIKLDTHKITFFFIALVILVLCFFLISLLLHTKTIYMTNDNFTDILKSSHENISKYIGKRIVTSGYIFKPSTFDKDKFVVARDMLINNNEACIVGFLCSFDESLEFNENEWVEISGVITKGDYYGPIPIIKVDTIKKITTPNNTFVYPPTSK